MKRLFLSYVTAVAFAFHASGVPAMPGKMQFIQSDGSVIEAYMYGDEYFHFYETADGAIFLRDADGVFKYAEITADGRIAAGDVDVSPLNARSAAEMDVVSRQNPALLRDAIRRHYAEVKDMTNSCVGLQHAPGAIKNEFPTTGSVRGLIILAEYQDVKFLPKSTREYFDAKINQEGYEGSETYGSVADYFKEQSSGQFAPVFDVVGPVTLPHERAYYGLYELIDDQVRDACVEADSNFGVDFTRYDANDDGFVDFVFVIYAGHGEAQGGPAESFWPAMKDLSNSVYDYFDGMCLSRAACSCELKGGSGEDWDGVGTICHEFSHILGLPDIYDATNGSGYGMGHYDIMDIGTYNGDSTTPSGYTAMDKYTLGWIEPLVLDTPGTDFTLEAFPLSNEAYFIVNPENADEYYTLENRWQIGWDSAIPGEGLVISYVHYDSSVWKRNTVNSPTRSGYEHVRIIAADNLWNSNDEQDDPYPAAGNTAFTDTSSPAAGWNTGSTKQVNQPVTNIRYEGGVIKFDFKTSSGIKNAEKSAAEVIGGNGRITVPANAEIYNMQGMRVGCENLAPGIYVVRLGGVVSKVSVK